MERFEIPDDWIWHGSEGAVRVATPPEWEAVNAKELIGAENVILAVAAAPLDDGVFVTNINIVPGRSVQPGESLDEYAVSEQKVLAGELSDFQLIDLATFELGGVTWSEMLAAYQGSEDALTLLQRTTMPEGIPPLVVSATADTNEWPEVEGLIHAILTTVEVVEQA